MLEENKAKGSTENKEEGTVKKKKLAVTPLSTRGDYASTFIDS